jgi:uncharacterized membrane protein YhaH (DUF805 family)
MQNRDGHTIGSPLYKQWDAEAVKCARTPRNLAIEWGRLFFSFFGRIGRAQYWKGLGSGWLLTLLPIVILAANGGSDQWSLAIGLWAIVWYVALFAVAAKRLHDVDMSGWWSLGAMIIFGMLSTSRQDALTSVVSVALFSAIIWLGCARGTAGENRFGPEPVRRPADRLGSTVDYYSIIAKALSGLPDNTVEARQALYDRARAALAAQLEQDDPKRLALERTALEKAIREAEAISAVRGKRRTTADNKYDQASQERKGKSHIESRGNSVALQIASAAFIVPLYIVYSLAGPATYVLLVISTWQSDMSLGWKVVYWLTIDLVLAGFWPGLWVWWLLKCAVGYCSTTPLSLLFG